MLNLVSEKYNNINTLKYGSGIFANSSQTTFKKDLSEIVAGNHMFYNNKKLESIKTDFISLQSARGMFKNCTLLSHIDVKNLKSLEDGYEMFRNTNIHDFTYDMPSLKNGDYMFYGTPLSEFVGDLDTLETGNQMFRSASLSAVSVRYIFFGLPERTNNPTITIGINVQKGTTEEETMEALNYFAKKASFDSWENLKSEFASKGWNAQFLYGGKSTSITYGLRRINTPVYARVEEVFTKGEKENAEYTSEDGQRCFNLEYFNDGIDTTGYTLFDSLEEAIEHFNIKPVERN